MMKIVLLLLYVGIAFGGKDVDLEQYYNETGCLLTPINNGKYAHSGRSTNNSMVHVICELGFQLNGEPRVSCDGATGNLTTKLPECIGCKLRPLDNGDYLDLSQIVGAPAVYSRCKKGFRHVGQIYHFCNISTSELTNDNYTCEDINECVELAVNGGAYVRGPCDDNAVCTNTDGSYNCTCNDKYTGNGTYCRLTSNCKVLTDPKNGAVKLTQKYAYFTCNAGYTLIGRMRLRCNRGKWKPSRFLPFCYKPDPDCTPPIPIENGYHIGEDYNVGKSIRNGCNNGYILDGPAAQNCTVNGWTSGTPFCDKLSTDTVLEMATILKEKIDTLNRGPSSYGRLYKNVKNGADIVFMLDRSSSILPSSLELIRKFVLMIVDQFGVNNQNPKEGGSRVALVTFGTDVEVVFNLDDKKVTSSDVVKERLYAIKPHGGETALRPALEVVLLEVARKIRPGAQKALFIIADGQSTLDSKLEPKHLISGLKNKDFELFVIGVGSLKNIEELVQYSSKPHWKHFFVLEKFKDLEMLTNRVVLEKTSPVCGKGRNVTEPTKNEMTSAQGDWPWLGLIYDENSHIPEPICGGSIICKNWFLTSASCASVDKKITVELGMHNITDNPKRLIPVEIHRHPEFNNMKYDLALLKFNDTSTKDIFSSVIQPVCLSKQIGLATDYVSQEGLWISGWGANLPNNKQHAARTVPVYAKLPVVDRDKCEMSFPSISIPNGTFCAGHRFNVDKACRGDTGGPIVRRTDRGYEVVGLASRTYLCDETERYGLFTEVLTEKALGWVHRVTKECNIALREHYYN